MRSSYLKTKNKMAAPMMSQILSKLTRQVSCWSHPRENPHWRGLTKIQLRRTFNCTIRITFLSFLESFVSGWPIFTLVGRVAWFVGNVSTQHYISMAMVGWKRTTLAFYKWRLGCSFWKLILEFFLLFLKKHSNITYLY